MPWNHRVMRHVDKLPDHLAHIYPNGESIYYQIHEVYYNEKGEPDGWTKDAITPQGDTVEDLRKDLEMILTALDKPVLEYK